MSRTQNASRPLRSRRRDAQRNRDLLVAAAETAFSEHGLDAPLDEIARRAGVGIGTLYRHFRTRSDLIDAVFADELQASVRAAEDALGMPDPWTAFARYIERTCELQAIDRGYNDLMSMRFPSATATEAAKNRVYELLCRLIERAQADGTLRHDLTPEDIASLLWANARVVEATRAIAPDAWRRHLAFTLDGFRATNAHPLPVPAMNPRQVVHAMQMLGRSPSGSAGG